MSAWGGIAAAIVLLVAGYIIAAWLIGKYEATRETGGGVGRAKAGRLDTQLGDVRTHHSSVTIP